MSDEKTTHPGVAEVEQLARAAQAISEVAPVSPEEPFLQLHFPLRGNTNKVWFFLQKPCSPDDYDLILQVLAECTDLFVKQGADDE